jgi:hypothetical protein
MFSEVLTFILLGAATVRGISSAFLLTPLGEAEMFSTSIPLTMLKLHPTVARMNKVS